MNETLDDLEQKRNAVELDIQALYETLQKEINEQKKIWEKAKSLISFSSDDSELLKYLLHFLLPTNIPYIEIRSMTWAS